MLHLFKYHFVFGLAEISKPRQRDFEGIFSFSKPKLYKILRARGNGEIHQNIEARQRDFEQKFSADDREAYKSTPREETKITNEKSIVMEENRRVFILII